MFCDYIIIHWFTKASKIATQSFLRYYLIKFLNSRKWCTSSKTKFYIISVTAFSIIYNIPRFMELKVLEGYDENVNSTTTYVAPTDFR